MADHDMIPVRDLNRVDKNDPAGQMRRMVNKWTRDELEDKYLRNYEENIILKKHARKQEEKIKKMATKLLRLVNDKKKNGEIGTFISQDEASYEKLKDLEKQNLVLKEKVAVLKHQIVTMNQRPTGYDYVQARIDTGIPHRPSSPTTHVRINRSIRVSGPSPSKRVTHSPTTMLHQHSVLEESTRASKRLWEDRHEQQRDQLHSYEMEIKRLQEQMRIRETEYQDDMAKIQQQTTEDHRLTMKENVDLIKLQREISTKSSKLIEFESRYHTLEEKMHIIRCNRDELLVEMESLNVQLKEEQNKVLTLQNQIRNFSAKERKLFETEEQVKAAERENEILKEANEKLVSSAFDLEREREWRQRENALKVQIAQLEATMKADLGEKGSIIDKYSYERDSNEKLQSELRECQVNYYTIKEQYDDLLEKMKFFTRESEVDMSEIEEALVLIKQRKQKNIKKPDFLHQVDDEKEKDYKKGLLELQAEYAETVHELEKTRNMLVVQHKINKDYQQEVDSFNHKMDDLKKEYEMKLEEYARLLDIRAARIRKMENQMKDVAYGTRQYKIQIADDDAESTMDFDETVAIERGQNLFEIHVHKLNLSQEALRIIGDEEPSTFCTWEFFEFETQSTPVCRGPRPVFDFTSQYVVKVDDFFLHYLQKKTCTLELHQSFGQDFRTISACQLKFNDIFDKPHGRIHGVASLTGIEDGEGSGVGYGTVEYWIRLRVPMEQALRLYKERTKALGYITHNDRNTIKQLEVLDDAAKGRPMDNVNELHVKIRQCSRLKSRRSGVQPSPYCVYSFFDFGDHDTRIIANSNQPVFNDHMTFPVPMTFELDQYLRQEHLQIFVFDDTDPDETSYIGMVDIPLLSLANGKNIEGPFDLKNADGTNSGIIELDLHWQYSYLAPKSPRRAKYQAMEVTEERDEADQAPPPTPPKVKSRVAAKFTSSTPMPKQPDTKKQPEIFESEISVVKTESSPKPVARRRLESSKTIQQPSQDTSQDTMVDVTVNQVVSGFMPNNTATSDSVSSVTTLRHMVTEVTVHKTEAERPESEEEVEEEIPDQIEEEEKGIESDNRSVIIHPSSASESSRNEDTRAQKPKPKIRSLRFYESPMEIKISPKASPRSVSSMKDTYFGDKKSEVEEEEESVTEEIESDRRSVVQEESNTSVNKLASESESDRGQRESDSEGVVMIRTLTQRRRVKDVKKGNIVTIAISNLSIEPDSTLARDDNITNLYVEYSFLGLPTKETETPYSLPKPRPGKQIEFNFSKTIQVDLDKHYGRRQELAAMLLPKAPDEGRIRFNVISEPAEGIDGECEDVGVAFVSIPDILKYNSNVKDEDVDIYDVRDEKTVIGSMNLTVDCLAALKAIDKEMIEGTY